jgi:hypothetical protein
MTSPSSMSDQSSALPPLPGARPKRRLRWLKIIVGIIAAGFLVIGLLGSTNSPKLEVQRTGFFHQGNIIKVLNIGAKPITITGVSFNNRADCISDEKRERQTLNVGDSTTFVSRCQIVRASIETDQGTATYSFSGPPD